MAQPGDVLLGRFEVRESLGAGGLAEVVRAFDRQVGGEVALKLLHPHLAKDAVVRERFRREVQVTRTLDHPGIVRAFDLFEDGERVFFSMELLRGQTLADRVRDGPALSDSEVSRIGREALVALGHAHAQGIVHRDLKPHNVFLCADGRVKLLDFGTARLAGASRLTTHSGILGTPDYVAPEVLEGKGDQRADIYSLGATLYEALSGKPPFAGKSALELLRAHADTPPAPLPPERKGPLAEAVMRALEKNPERRFRDAGEFVAALDGRLTPVHAFDPDEGEAESEAEPVAAGRDGASDREQPEPLTPVAAPIGRVDIPREVPGRRWWIEASSAPGNAVVVGRRIQMALGREIPDLTDRLEKGPVVIARGLRHRDAERIHVQLEQAGIPVWLRRSRGSAFPWFIFPFFALPWVWRIPAVLIGIVISVVFGLVRWGFGRPQPRGRGVGQGRRFGGRTPEEWERQVESWGRQFGERMEQFGKEMERRMGEPPRPHDDAPRKAPQKPTPGKTAPAGKPRASPTVRAAPPGRIAPLLHRVEARAARIDKLTREGSPSRQRVAEDLTAATKDILGAARTLSAEAQKIELFLAGLDPEAEEWETIRALRARLAKAGSEEEKVELGEIIATKERALSHRAEMETRLSRAENRLLRIIAALDETAGRVFGAGVADAQVTRPLRELEKETQFAEGAVREIDQILRDGAPPPRAEKVEEEPIEPPRGRAKAAG